MDDREMLLAILVVCVVCAVALGIALLKKLSVFSRIRGTDSKGREFKSVRSTGNNRLLARWRKKFGRESPARAGKLIEAAELGKLGTIRRLIAEGINANAKRHRGGRTALMKASANNHFEVVKLLLENGASVDSGGGRSGKTALMRASENACIDSMRLLLRFGADPNKKSVLTGKTALMIASENGHLGAVELLLDGGADVNFRDRMGKTPLMFAVRKDHKDGLEIVRRLIRAGSRINDGDNNGKRAVDIAFESGLGPYVHILEANGAVFGIHANRSVDFLEASDLERAYLTLRCTKTDSDDHVRNQYRLLAKLYHPDLIQAKELPNEFLVLAGEQFHEINDSYQKIMKSREQLQKGG
jgi:ankyrin repeat protein